MIYPYNFELLYLCLAKDNLLHNVPLKIKEASVQEEEAITKSSTTIILKENCLEIWLSPPELNNEDSDRGTKKH